jgi:hypothetical protein
VKKGESNALKTKELEKVVLDRMKKNVKYKKMRELGAGWVGLRGWDGGFANESRAQART